jgi:hypothetical protein
MKSTLEDGEEERTEKADGYRQRQTNRNKKYAYID